MLSTDVLERQVLDALPMTVYAVDLEGRLTSIDRSWSRLGELHGASVPAKGHDAGPVTIWDVLQGGASRDQIEHAMEILRTGRAPLVRWEFSRRSRGGEQTFLMQVTPLHDDSHAVSGFVFSSVDITESHQSRELLVDSGLALSRTIDLDRVLHEVGQQVRRVMRCDAFVAAVAERDSGAPRVAYQFGYDGDHHALEQRLGPVWRDALESGRVAVSHANSATELTAPMIGAGAPLGVLTLLIERVDSPRGIEEVQRLLPTIAAQTATAIERAWLVQQVGHKRRLETIGEVAAGVAHELRNPLFGISSAAQLLRFRAREDPVVEKNVGRIMREAERLNRMVAALLEFGRPLALKLSPGDPDSIWDDVLESHRGRLEARVLALRRTRPENPVSIPIDAEQLAQVFTNLLINSVDAAPEASDITLHSAVLPNGSWRCQLGNAGAPIPPDVLPRVFQIFFSTKAGSTGIGLALCERIVEQHRGAIGVESTAERTTVTVTLPPR